MTDLLMSKQLEPVPNLVIGVCVFAAGIILLVFAMRQMRARDNRWGISSRPWWFHLPIGIVITLVGVATIVYAVLRFL